MNTIMNNQKFLRDDFSKEQVYRDELVHFLKIDTKDRNTQIYPDPFNFSVKFNGSENSQDKFGNTGLTIQVKFNSIKYIEICNLIVPRFLWDEDTFLSIKLKGFKFYSPSIFVTSSLLQLNSLNLILSNNDIISVSGSDYTIYAQNNNTSSELLLQNYTPNIVLQPLILKKIKLAGTITTKDSDYLIYGTETNFNYLTIGDSISVWNKTFTINQVLSSNLLQVNEQITFTEENIDIYLINKPTIYTVSSKENNMNQIISVSPENLNSKWNSGTFTNRSGFIKTLVNGDILLLNNQIVFFDSIDVNGRIKIKNTLITPVYYGQMEYLDNQSTILIDGTGQTFSYGSNVLTSSFVNFTNFTKKTIFQLDDGLGKFKYIKLVEHINLNKISTIELYSDAGFGTPQSLNIFPASYERTRDIGCFPYINLVIEELSDSELPGTNNLLNKSFALTNSRFDGQLNRFLYLTTFGKRIYNVRSLQNLKKLTFKFYTPSGELINMNNLLTKCGIEDERHVLNPTNQVSMIIKIVEVDHQFN
jgi:hypothetical protein